MGAEEVGYRYGVLDGVHGAIQTGPEEDRVECPRCKHGDRSEEALANCVVCKGRGRVDSVPYCDRPWDQVADQLWLGGHFTARGPLDGTDCRLDDDPPFEVVVSMCRLYDEDDDGDVTGNGHWRPDVSTHLEYLMRDIDLDPGIHGDLYGVADFIAGRVGRGDRVLVRCQAGINRSALVLGLALRRMGEEPGEFVPRMRELRSPFVLFNESFEHHLYDYRGSTS